MGCAWGLGPVRQEQAKWFTKRSFSSVVQVLALALPCHEHAVWMCDVWQTCKNFFFYALLWRMAALLLASADMCFDRSLVVSMVSDRKCWVKGPMHNTAGHACILHPCGHQVPQNICAKLSNIFTFFFALNNICVILHTACCGFW